MHSRIPAIALLAACIPAFAALTPSPVGMLGVYAAAVSASLIVGSAPRSGAGVLATTSGIACLAITVDAVEAKGLLAIASPAVGAAAAIALGVAAFVLVRCTERAGNRAHDEASVPAFIERALK